LRFTYIKKLSPGLIEESIPVIAIIFFEGAGLFPHAANKNNEAKRKSNLFVDI
jgi:hypothetical protein